MESHLLLRENFEYIVFFPCDIFTKWPLSVRFSAKTNVLSTFTNVTYEIKCRGPMRVFSVNCQLRKLQFELIFTVERYVSIMLTVAFKV
jgi:hypothetical protein